MFVLNFISHLPFQHLAREAAVELICAVRYSHHTIKVRALLEFTVQCPLDLHEEEKQVLTDTKII